MMALIIIGLVAVFSLIWMLGQGQEAGNSESNFSRRSNISSKTKQRGTSSERSLIRSLRSYGVPKETIFHDLFIEKGNGKFAQIDVVVPITEGILVFEVKDYSGWIFGNGKNSSWTQVLAFGKKKFRFYNPVRQNESHIRDLNQVTKDVYRKMAELRNHPGQDFFVRKTER